MTSIGVSNSRGGERFGAGRPARRLVAEDLDRLDAAAWRRAIGFQAGEAATLHTSNGRWLRYTTFDSTIHLEHNVAGQAASQVVGIDRTPCHLGGARAWFVCPDCGRRAGVLFLVGACFTCRRCGDVCYRTQRLGPHERTERALRKAKAKLNRDGSRPKGMKWMTFERLRAAVHAADERWYKAVVLSNVAPALRRLAGPLP